MARPTATHRYVFRRLTGFGWFGVVGVAVLGLMVCGAIGDFDFHYLVNRIVLGLFGVDAMMYFVGLVLISHWLYILGPLFGLIGAMILAIALFVSPRPVPVWQWMLIVAWGVLEPLLIGRVAWWLTPRSSQGLTQLGMSHFSNMLLVSHCLLEFMTIGLIWLTTRSRAVTLIVTAIIALGTLDEYMRSMTLYTLDTWLVPESIHAYGYHAAMLVTLLWWAIAARRNAPRSGQCQMCGYHIAGTALTVCPQCGTPISRF